MGMKIQTGAVHECNSPSAIPLQAGFNGEEAAVLRAFHCRLLAAEEDETGPRAGHRTRETNCGVHGHVSIEYFSAQV